MARNQNHVINCIAVNYFITRAHVKDVKPSDVLNCKILHVKIDFVPMLVIVLKS